VTVGVEKSGKIPENCDADLENVDVVDADFCTCAIYFSYISCDSASEVQNVKFSVLFGT